MQATASVLLNRLLARARLRHLQVLVQVAELRSFRKAALAAGLTQPAVTYVITDLERLLGTTLFDRHARGVDLTAAAADLVPVARRMLLAMGQGAEAVAARLQQGDGVVRIAATVSAIGGLLARVVPSFSERHPQVLVHVTQAESDLYLELVGKGDVDLVACRQPAVVPGGWVFRGLIEDRLVVVCAPTHPLARLRKPPLEALSDATWAVPPVQSLARAAIEALAAERGWTLRLSPVVTRALPMTWALLQRQPLVSLLPASVVTPLVDAGQLVVLDLERAWPADSLGLLHPAQGVGHAAQRFMQFLSDPPALPEAHRRPLGAGPRPRRAPRRQPAPDGAGPAA